MARYKIACTREDDEEHEEPSGLKINDISIDQGIQQAGSERRRVDSESCPRVDEQYQARRVHIQLIGT
jgi:hypothetical protein